MAVLLYIPTNSVQGFPFLYSLANTCLLFVKSYSNMWGAVSLSFWFAKTVFPAFTCSDSYTLHMCFFHVERLTWVTLGRSMRLWCRTIGQS
jgi:hypothetical protein